MPAGHQRRARRNRFVDMLAHLGRNFGVVERSHRHALMQRVAENMVPGVARDALGERLDDAAMSKDAAGRGADLPGVGERAVGRRLRCAVEIGVPENHERSIAAQFEQHRFSRAAFRDAASRLWAAGESDAVRVRVGNDLVPDRLPLADDEIDDPVRRPGRRDRPHQSNRRHRRRGSRRPNDRVAGDDAGREIFDRNVDGVVPGRDDGVDPPGLPQRHHELAGILRRQGFAPRLFREFRRQPEAVGRLGDFAGRLRERLALLDAQRAGNFAAFLVDPGGYCDTQIRAPPEGLRGPRGFGPLGGGDRLSRAGAVALRQPSDLAARRGIDRRHPIRRLLPSPVDEVAQLLDRIRH